MESYGLWRNIWRVKVQKPNFGELAVNGNSPNC